MPIKNLPAHLRPQEKALRHGIDSLSELEMLALILRAGSAKSDALQLSSNLLQKFGSIKNLLDAPIENILKIKGIGKVKALQLKAIDKIMWSCIGTKNAIIETLPQMIEFAFSHIGDFNKENFLIVLLNRSNEVIFQEVMYKGTQSEVTFSPKEIISMVVTKNASKFFVVHNHPSGDVSPSRNDVTLTKQLSYVSKLFELMFLDHIIINSKKDYQLISW